MDYFIKTIVMGADVVAGTDEDIAAGGPASRHTLPEGFFIQVFMATIILLISCFWIFISWINVLIPIYFFVTCKQLFGYGWWGTVWRAVVCLFVGFVLFNLFIGICDLFFMGHFARPKIFAANVSISIALLIIAHFINKNSEKKRLSAETRKMMS